MKRTALSSATIAMALAFSTMADARESADLDAGWHFHFGDAPANVTDAAFGDTGWTTVALPHTWNRLGEYATQRSAATDNHQGIGWYRLSFTAPAAHAGQRQWLDFGAVSNIADVWVNGVHVGQHRGAFSRFRFDVTAQWKPGAANLIVVRADNSKPASGSSTSEILPLAGDFFIYGGIYRKVRLITTEPVHIDLADYGGPGVYARATALTDASASISVLTRIANQAGATRRLTGVVTITDAGGRQVASGDWHNALAAGARGEQSVALTIPHPHRWNGRADPYLYTVNVELRDGGRLVDQVSQPLGLRDIRIDPDKGLFLNGQHLALYGVSRHQDRAGKGWAISDADAAEDMALIAEMGANTIRMAHYEHADGWYDLADKAGMIAWAEVPYVSTPSYDGSEGSPATFANAEQQTRELIRQQYNHPAEAMWSIGNEVDASAIFLGNGKQARALALLRAIGKTVKAEDPSRYTTFADCCEAAPFTPAPNPTGGAEMLAGTADLSGYNRYYGWYYPEPLKAEAQFGAALDSFHAKHPMIPMSVSEYGAGGALSQHSDNPLGGLISAFGRPHPEEYQAWVHEANWAAIKARPYLFASWVWNMFDFASDLREEGESIDLNDKGLVTFDRKTRKDAFWYYKAQWSDAPVLHINGQRYADRAYPVMDVRVYSNAPKVRLTMNGRDLGEVACAGHVCAWANVALAPGANHAEARGQIAGQTVTDTADWTAPDAAKGLHIDAGDLVGHIETDGTRYGSDHFFEGGVPKLLNMRGGFHAKPKAPIIVQSAHPALFEGWREGNITYRLPLPAGRWAISLHTFEPEAARPAPRRFDVRVNGAAWLTGFDPAQAAGGALHEAVKTTVVEAKDGYVTLAFAGSDHASAPVVAAIDVMPAGQK